MNLNREEIYIVHLLITTLTIVFYIPSIFLGYEKKRNDGTPGVIEDFLARSAGFISGSIIILWPLAIVCFLFLTCLQFLGEQGGNDIEPIKEWIGLLFKYTGYLTLLFLSPLLTVYLGKITFFAINLVYVKSKSLYKSLKKQEGFELTGDYINGKPKYKAVRKQ